LTKGASTAASPCPVINAAIEICIAVIFSAAMRWYSSAEQTPWAIISVRCQIVSHDAAVSRAIIVGST